MNVTFTLLAGIVPAVVSGVIAFAVTTWRLRGELEQQRAGSIATLRQRYVNPLRYWATRLSVLLSEIEEKVTDPKKYEKKPGETRGWFQTLKRHAEGSKIRDDLRGWCYYEGIFAITTIYYACSYIQVAREVRFQLPFSELDPVYSQRLDDHLSRVTDALGGRNGIWDSSQEVLGEVFTMADQKLSSDELCRVLDSHDTFKVAPFYRMLDAFIEPKLLAVAKIAAIRGCLDELINFLASERTPEWGRRRRVRSRSAGAR
jgi:hypothetical protein